MDTVKEGIRRNLAGLIAASGKRNVDLATAIGVGKSAVSNWVNGNSSIDIERIPAICDFFGVTIDEFFGRAKEMQPNNMSDDEEELLLYRSMHTRERQLVLENARAFAQLSGSGVASDDRTVKGVVT